MARKLKTKRIFFLFSIPILIGFSILGYKLLSLDSKEQKPELTQDEINQVRDIVSGEKQNPNKGITSKEVESDNDMYIAGWIAYWDFEGGFQTLKSNSKNFSSVSPTWYSLSPRGNLIAKNTARNSSIIKYCQDKNITIIPSISNSNAEELSIVLNNRKVLDKHVNHLVQEAKKYNYDGIDIDYEHIKAEDKDAFSNFIEQLGNKLHRNGKKLTIAILWKNDLDGIIEAASSSRAAQDWEKIGKSVDEFRIMAYDYTHSYQKSGPIAPKDWIISIIEYAKEHVDTSKIVLGLPLYAYEWTEGTTGAKALVWDNIQEIKSNQQYKIMTDQFDPKSLEKKLIYTSGNHKKVIWYQDGEVTRKRVELAKSYGIEKFAFWRLGGEDPNIFNF